LDPRETFASAERSIADVITDLNRQQVAGKEGSYHMGNLPTSKYMEAKKTMWLNKIEPHGVCEPFQERESLSSEPATLRRSAGRPCYETARSGCGLHIRSPRIKLTLRG
jgi:hypothetical protein